MVQYTFLRHLPSFLTLFSSSVFLIQTLKLKDHKLKDGKEKGRLSFKGLKAQKKKKPPDTTGRNAFLTRTFLLVIRM